MKLPTDCPYAVTPPKRILGDVIKTMPCCQAHCLFRSLGDDEVPLCRSWGTEVYRLAGPPLAQPVLMLRQLPAPQGGRRSTSEPHAPLRSGTTPAPTTEGAVQNRAHASASCRRFSKRSPRR
jgi:hypothetical protein